MTSDAEVEASLARYPLLQIHQFDQDPSTVASRGERVLFSASWFRLIAAV